MFSLSPRRRLFLILCIFGPALAATDCTSFRKMLMIAGDDPVPEAERAAARSAGQELFAQHCVSCHGMDGAGVEELSHRDDGTPVRLAELAAQKSVKTFAANIYYGKGTRMVAFREQLSEAEIWQLAHYVKSFAKSSP